MGFLSFFFITANRIYATKKVASHTTLSFLFLCSGRNIKKSDNTFILCSSCLRRRIADTIQLFSFIPLFPREILLQIPDNPFILAIFQDIKLRIPHNSFIYCPFCLGTLSSRCSMILSFVAQLSDGQIADTR